MQSFGGLGLELRVPGLGCRRLSLGLGYPNPLTRFVVSALVFSLPRFSV